jgi:hypothetical protein
MLRFAADENLNNDIVRGLFRRKPELDIIRIQDAGLSGSTDQTVLEWCADSGRVLLTHDVSTITNHAYARVSAGKTMPGVFEISRNIPLGVAIEDISCLRNAASTVNGRDKSATCQSVKAIAVILVAQFKWLSIYLQIQFNPKNNSSTAIFFAINP